jgi:hypothetical protein
VDDAGSTGVQQTFFAAEYMDEINPVITYDKSWEKIGSTYARPFSGGVSYHAPTRTYRMWYGCGDNIAQDSNNGLCMATSMDGLTWDKPTQPIVRGTNIVVNFSLRSNNVWHHPTATNLSHRYVLADTNGPHHTGNTYWLFGSPDGIHWTSLRNTTGPTADRGTVFHDPFRKRWVFSIKGYGSKALAQYGRHRMYWETPSDDPFGDRVLWNETDPVLWAAADTLDQPGVLDGQFWLHPELYTLDVSPYESVHVGYYTTIRGKRIELSPPDGQKGQYSHPEYDSVYLGFSRNGFDFSRPPADQPTNGEGYNLQPGKRRPFGGMSPEQRVGSTVGNTSWNFGGVQSVTGSPVLAPDNDTLLFYYGAQRGFSVMCVGPGSQTGVARLGTLVLLTSSILQSPRGNGWRTLLHRLHECALANPRLLMVLLMVLPILGC